MNIRPSDGERPQANRVVNRRSHRLELVIGMLLILSTLAVYQQIGTHDFINYDDNALISQNNRVRNGLTKEGLVWSFTTFHSGNWHPLTWLSHMLDCQLFGLKAGMHHLTGLAFHLANTLLLFLVLKRMTGALWSSAFVAALFALHPLHVESVAWAAERKDVLSTLFWMLTLWGYIRYVERPSAKKYVWVVFFFVLGLMSKPMLVTLPFVLLLLDYWPLGRWRPCFWGEKGSKEIEGSSLFRLIREKTPLFALSVAFSVLAFIAQQAVGAVRSANVIPLDTRVANALVSYIGYLKKTFLPLDLAIFYPYNDPSALWHAVAAATALIGVSFIAAVVARRSPYLVVGWLWYLGTLVPVIGLVQVGGQSMADRYTYIPLIGIFIIIAWGVPALLERWRYRRIVLGISACLLLLAIMVCTRLQVDRWQNSATVFAHAIEVTSNNHQAHNNLGLHLLEKKDYQGAVRHFGEVTLIRPNFPSAHINMGIALDRLGKSKMAVLHFAKALSLDPKNAKAHSNLGGSLAKMGRLKGAVIHLSEALRIMPESAEAHNGLGIVLARQGNFQEAISHFSEALRIRPGDIRARRNLERAKRLSGMMPAASSSLTP